MPLRGPGGEEVNGEALVRALGIYDHPDIVVTDYQTAEATYLECLGPFGAAATALAKFLSIARPELDTPLDPSLAVDLEALLKKVQETGHAALNSLKRASSVTPTLLEALPHASGDMQTAFFTRSISTIALNAAPQQD